MTVSVNDPNAPRTPRGSISQRIKKRLFRWSFTKRKLSTKNLDRLCREFATDEYTLVVHSEDVDYEPYFPNAFTVTKRLDCPADMHVDIHYRELSKVATESFNMIVCTGLLEHVPEPEVLVEELRRILKPGGRLVMSASAVFSFHECPDNFFHFTPYGMKLLARNFSKIEMIRGSSQPFETIGILMQRIHLQCEIFPLVRPLVEVMFHTVRVLDFFVTKQYDTRAIMDERTETDSMLPSNMQMSVIK
ncbi:MAG: class I SAM-dependent methyltransferase [Gammaproteobacteria bacterium]